MTSKRLLLFAAVLTGLFAARRSCACVAAGAQAGPEPSTFEVATPGGTLAGSCEVVRATLLAADGVPEASMVGYGYFVPGARRPVTFFWNGGPGLPSAMLHAGFAAPRIADLAGDGAFSDNPHTLIDATDLIYVDPVGTGYSEAIAPAEDGDFFGVHEDARAAARYVAAVLEARGWQDRTVYLCGESYGGIRVAAMLEPLRERGVVPAGLILISPALETRLLRATPDVAMYRTVCDVPTLAALALEDGTVDGASPREHVDAARAFAFGPLLDAVRAGADIEFLEDEALLGQLEAFTGGRMMRTLRGRDAYDARQRARPSRLGGMAVDGAMRAVREILRRRFGLQRVDGYTNSARGLGFSWPGYDGLSIEASDLRVSSMLLAAAERMQAKAPRVFVAGGWYDVVVPFAIAEGLVRDGACDSCEIELHDYPAGHMIYVDPAAHEALADDLHRWFAAERR